MAPGPRRDRDGGPRHVDGHPRLDDAGPVIRPTRPEEHEALSALALRSKGHWGYPPEFLEACREELRYDAATCGSELMWAAERLLLEHALDQARARGARRVLLDADPGAESFYRRFGAVRIGSAPSGSIPGRVLPRLEFRLVGDAEAVGA